jgi:hypothetical protein
MMENEKATAALDKAIIEGESIQWKATPQDYKLSDADHKKETQRYFIIAIACAIVLNGIFLFYCFGTAEGKFNAVPLAFTLGIPLWFIMEPIRDRGEIRRLLYAITDKRIIVIGVQYNAISIPLEKFNFIHTEPNKEGNVHILLGGEEFKIAGRKLISCAARGYETTRGESSTLTGLVFYNLNKADCDEVYSILEESNVPLKSVA